MSCELNGLCRHTHERFRSIGEEEARKEVLRAVRKTIELPKEVALSLDINYATAPLVGGS